MNQYNPLYHKQNECRNDHPTLNKIPPGFRGFHVEDYDEDFQDGCEERITKKN